MTLSPEGELCGAPARVGTFPGRMPEPSPEGLKPLADLVLETKADFGVAHDGRNNFV